MVDAVEPKPKYWTKASVDSIAERFADALDLKPGGDLMPIVSALGGKIVYGFQQMDEVFGGSILVRSPDDFTIVLSEMTSPKRDRFTLAHELVFHV